MTVRSTAFWVPAALTPANTFVVLYTVPAGRTARFSLVTVANGGGAAALVYVLVGPSGSENFVFIESVPANTSRPVLQGLVMRPGWRVLASCAVNNVVTVAGFGSLLEGAPT